MRTRRMSIGPFKAEVSKSFLAKARGRSDRMRSQVADRIRPPGRTAPPRTWLVLAGAGGAALAYLFDPSMGKTRRTQVRQRTAGIARSTGRWVARASRGAGARAQGLTRRLAHRAHELKDWDDITLAHKVESEVLGGPAIPKEKISVDAHDGIIVLRGEIDDDDLIRLIEQEVRSTPGVRDVENLMHTTGTMPPNRADALRAGRTSR